MTRAVIYGVLAGFVTLVLGIMVLDSISVAETAVRDNTPSWKLVKEHAITRSLYVAGWALACAVGGSVAARRIPGRWLEAAIAVAAILLLLGPLPEAVFQPRNVGWQQIAYFIVAFPAVLGAAWLSARRRGAVTAAP